MICDVTSTLPRDRNPLWCLTCHKYPNKSRNKLKLCIYLSYTFNNMYTKFYMWLIFSLKIIEKVYVILRNSGSSLVYESESSKFVDTGEVVEFIIYKKNAMLEFIVAFFQFSFFHLSLSQVMPQRFLRKYFARDFEIS